MQIFIHKGKYADIHYRFDTEEERQYAWLQHFQLNDDLTYFEDAVGTEAEYVKLARQGNWKAAKRLAEVHARMEYEGYEIVTVHGPQESETLELLE